MTPEWKLLITKENREAVKKFLRGPHHVGAAFSINQYIVYVPITQCVGSDWGWWPKGCDTDKEEKYSKIPEISFEEFMMEFIKDPEYINMNAYQIY